MTNAAPGSLLRAFRAERKEYFRIFWIGSSLVGGAGLTFLSQIIFARGLTAAEFGSLVAALAVIRLISPLAGFGLNEFWLAKFGSEGWQARRWLRPSLGAFAITAVAALIAGTLWALLGTPNRSTSIAVLFVLPMALFQALSSLAIARFQLEERYGNISVWAALPHLPRLLIALFAIYFHFQLVNILWALAAAYALLCIIPVMVIRGMAGAHFRLAGHGNRPSGDSGPDDCGLPEVLQGAKWFGLSGAFYLVHYQGMIILLEALAGPAEAADYGVAFTVLAAVFIIPTVLYRWYMMPKMHRWARNDADRLRRIYRKTFIVILVVALLVAAILIISAPSIVLHVFGNRYADSADILQWSSIAVVLRFASVAQGALLLSKGRVRSKVSIDIYCALFGMVAGIILISISGVTGGVVATILTELSLVFLYSGRLRAAPS